MVLIRQRPGSAKGVCFITLEDESGVANIVIWPDLMEKQRKVIMGARLMEVRGRVEYDETQSLHALSDDLLPHNVERGDHVKAPLPSKAQAPDFEPPGPGNRDCGWRGGHPRDVRIIPKSRDFH